ncbi:hypothetical protein [Salinibacterium sp. ZJ70]|uniref:hypothetical protein n=1 Tax=Salinibacterium sp. ZJ70 TaxID=2708084 RepID=UPI00174867B2|nr:hypothetical protein [Salinibacterium sp. ZJ70]
MSGCANLDVLKEEPTTVAELTLAEAKALAIETADEVASLYPADRVTERSSSTESRSLSDCRGEHNYAWPGRTSLVVMPETDQLAVLEPMAAELLTRPGWKAEAFIVRDGGRAALDFSAPNGVSGRVGFYKGASEVWVDVFSPCFHLPGGYEWGEKY